MSAHYSCHGISVHYFYLFDKDKLFENLDTVLFISALLSEDEF